MQGKPHAWGFKVWARTITAGLFCDFVVCQKSVLGVGADEALKLHETLPRPLDKARRWDKTTKAFTGSDINRPVALKTYNEKKMDGVDQLDDTKTIRLLLFLFFKTRSRNIDRGFLRLST
ncbi:hypothetical protein RRG08_035265 [Elysia crispata]|uniref:Uncharacterized protein n=1 Tax=Elysia crispata TaxID=231223 RepID=A0AAE1AHB1_9GAST|nr:hypothetical protein RRG08_035265 [Elysia crispata]